jgi:hypothetical protein
MIHWQKEGEQIRQGINVYHPKDTHSAGGCLRIRNHIWRARYSKIAKQWFFRYDKIKPNALQDWEDWANKI